MKNGETVGAAGADERLDGVLRVRHEADDVAGLVGDAGDVAERAVGVARPTVAEGDPALGLQLVERVLVGDVPAVHVLQRDVDLLAGRVVGGPGGVRVLHPQLLVAADEVQVVVAEHRAGQQVGLAEDLEAVADAEDRQSGLAPAR